MKTVIDELIEQLERTIPEVKNGNAIDKAYWKEKEKQQIINAHSKGQQWNKSGYNPETAEQYYKETYETKTSH